MSGIVCAIRGGRSSHPTIERAIALAQERKEQLYFLYVFNLEFLLHSMHSRADTITQDMRSMGEFILLMAQDLARKHDVEAEGVMRQGQVGEEIVNLCREVDADVVVLGSPQGEERNVFTPDRLQGLAADIAAETGAEVVLVSEERP
jgi:nucleotide-binding universal stress UspA family protein